MAQAACAERLGRGRFERAARTPPAWRRARGAPQRTGAVLCRPDHGHARAKPITVGDDTMKRLMALAAMTAFAAATGALAATQPHGDSLDEAPVHKLVEP